MRGWNLWMKRENYDKSGKQILIEEYVRSEIVSACLGGKVIIRSIVIRSELALGVSVILA
jgi:hypothetical protein